MDDLLAKANRVLLESRRLMDQHRLLRLQAAMLSKTIGSRAQSAVLVSASPEESTAGRTSPDDAMTG
jgi:hypothetical protein